MMGEVLIVASGHSATKVNDLAFKGKIVAVNNGWRAVRLWHYLIQARDFRGITPDKDDWQIIVKSYSKALEFNGGAEACGRSITLAASYWVLENLKPATIYYLGCDMNYTPDENGHTHFYGIGNDIKKGGIPDPDKMMNKYGPDNPDEYLKNIYMRFYNIATERGTKILNLSTDTDTRLPYPKGEYHE